MKYLLYFLQDEANTPHPVIQMPLILFSACIVNLNFHGWLFQSSLFQKNFWNFYLTPLLSPGRFFLQFFSIPHNSKITKNIVLSCAYFYQLVGELLVKLPPPLFFNCFQYLVECSVQPTVVFLVCFCFF